MLFRIINAGIAQSVQRLTTGWTVRGSNPGGGEIFRTRPDRPSQPPMQWVSHLSRGYSSRSVALTTHPLSSAEVKERVELYLYPPLGPRGLFCFYLYRIMNIVRKTF